ncbi:MipA/OmpV family protein [Paracoccus xiamenensis]|uniref:MipA/OmpV family protein n=1 Tax=Paracoccus xiamenensis TaxID=2714901 RepID=UPI00140A04C8|nr:MipA/OmpV family protein [Paracoccus xiamenensis]NHF71738.1 MipA/OmpV family protein [Paracoccus xiamenensis]
MKFALPLILALSIAAPAAAQDTIGTGPNKVSVDIGLGAAYKPTYSGSDEHEASPWLIMRDLRLRGVGAGEDTGFKISPNVNMIGPRDEDDDDRLDGLNDIDRAYEVGLKATYNMGQTTGYATIRKGFGGHEGIAGELGATYRFETTDRMTFWAGVEAGYGNGEFNETYYGVSDSEAARTDYDAYSADGGFNTASISLEGRYALTPNTAIKGEVKFSRIIGDAADSPIVRDRNQPSVRLGIVRTLNFAF